MARMALTYMRGFLKRYGPSKLKQRLWDTEFTSEHWDFIDNTAGDCVYSHIERHLRYGSILDLGCGPGNTANELTESSYMSYVGVDISEAAIAKGRRRTELNGRSTKNQFICADFISYQPEDQFDMILFRESMYHVPSTRVKSLLSRLAASLKQGGVFVVRLNTFKRSGSGHNARLLGALHLMETEFEVVEQAQYGDRGPTVIVFRPR